MTTMTQVSLSQAVQQVDVSRFLQNGDCSEDCIRIADSLRTSGAVMIRDPRVKASDAANFIDMMERYFAQPREIKLKDARPQLFYQVGVTPNGIERPRDNSAIASKLLPSEYPKSDPAARTKDPKWRFFWRCGERPADTDFPELNAPQIIPAAFESEWAETMDGWGYKLLNSLFTVADMLALSLDLPPGCLREKMAMGPHLLAPTGSDLSEISDESVGHALAGFHYDLNMLTIHGRARYPGLYVWTRDGTRIPVIVPEGFLLVQSGVQLEYLTAGTILRGMHEVVVSEATVRVSKEAKRTKSSLWRVSSTLFGHVRSDALLSPVGHFANLPNASEYSEICAGEQVAEELRALELAV